MYLKIIVKNRIESKCSQAKLKPLQKPFSISCQKFQLEIWKDLEMVLSLVHTKDALVQPAKANENCLMQL